MIKTIRQNIPRELLNTQLNKVCNYPQFEELNHKVNPCVKIGSFGNEEGQFRVPWGVSVDDKTDNIYVCDLGNNRMQVFNREGNYLFMFGDSIGVGKMTHPRCVTISDENVYVSIYGTGVILAFDLNGNFITRIENSNDERKQFNLYYGIAINETGEVIFACDCFNGKVEVLSNDYPFRTHFGEGILKYPVDIHLAKEHIYVLCQHSPYICSFDYNLKQIRSFISDDICKHLITSFGFCIDRSNNIIACMNEHRAVLIMNQQGDVLSKITEGISQPKGVALDSCGRIIIIANNNQLLIF